MQNQKNSLDANAQINLCVVRGVVGVALILAAGSMLLSALGKPVSEWHGNAILSIMGGLIGYLARDPKQVHSPTVDTADTVNVNTQGKGNP